MNARDRWLEYSREGGRLTFAEWCALRFDELDLRDRLWTVLGDPELLAALKAMPPQ